MTIGVSSNDANEGTVSPTSLVFTSDNWNAVSHIVTITGIDDDLDDGDQPFFIVLAAATSTDGNYDTLDPADVSVTNTDNDTAGFTISAISGDTGEDGSQATFTVKLNSQPTDDVTIAVSSSDEGEGTVSPASLTLTFADWDASIHIVTVTGIDDGLADGGVTFTVVLAAASSTDGNYNNLDPDDVTVTNTDNDSVGFTIGSVSFDMVSVPGGITFPSDFDYGSQTD